MHAQTPFSLFVKRLQESLTRMEPYEVVTIAQGVDGLLDAGAYLVASADVRKQTPGEVLPHCCSSAQAPADRRRRLRCPQSSK